MGPLLDHAGLRTDQQPPPAAHGPHRQVQSRC